MKNVLRKCAVILIAVFLLAAVPAFSAPAEDDGPELVVTFDAADLSGNYPITVKFTNAWGIDAANVTLEFDPAQITPVSTDEYEDVDEYYGCVSNIKDNCIKFAFMCVDDDGYTDDEEIILGSPLFTLADEALSADYIEVTATVTSFMCNDVVYSAEQRAAMSDVQRLPIHHYSEPDYQFSSDYATCTAMMVCQDEVCNHHIQAETVDTSYVVRGNPDCNSGGRIWYIADFTKDGFEHQEIPVNVDKIGHTGGESEVDSDSVVPATCTEDGSHDVVVSCIRCGFELSRETVTDPAFGHTPAEEVRENEVASQCLVAGSYDTVIYCETCGIELQRETVTTEPLQHRYIIPVDRIDPTCTEQGYTIYKCYRCGDTINDDFVDATGHTPLDAVEANRTEPTCVSEGGYDMVVYCEVCGTEISREHTVIPASGHTPAAAVTENQVAATCTANGSYDSVVYCSVCGTELSRSQNIVNASGHAYGAWTSVDDENHQRVCANDASHIETAAHVWNEGEVTTPPSVTSTGVMTYTCTVCGRERTEDIAKLKRPEITVQPVDVDLEAGEFGHFRVEVADGENVTYRWQYSSDKGSTWNNCGSTGFKTAELTTSVANQNSARYIYRCAVTNANGTVYTNSVKMNISGLAPVIGTQPQNISVTGGNTTTFSTEVISTTPVTYQWQYSYDNGEIWSNAGTAGAKTASLTSAVASGTTAKLIYRCKVTNSVGTTYTNNVRFYVSDIAPVINKQPVNPSVKKGETAQFTVGVISSSAVKYQWEYSYDSGETWQNAGTAGAKTATLTSAAASATTSKLIYRCKVTNANGFTYSYNVRFYVSDIAPVVNKQPVNPSVKKGETAQFTVGVISSSAVKYQWEYSYDSGETWQNAGTAGAKTATLTSAEASATTSKLIYRCKISNANGVTYSYNVRFYVSDIAPVVNKQPVNPTIKKGETAQFTVGVISSTAVKYQWEYSYDGGITWQNAGTAGAKTATLTSAVASATTSKLIYRCKISNANGVTYSYNVRFYVSDIAPVINKQPVNTPLKAGEKTQFTVGVISATSVSYQWQYSYDNGATWSNAGTSGNKTATLTSAPATTTTATMLYRCKVTNINGVTYTNSVRMVLTD